MEEVWKPSPIEEYAHLYEVSNLGNVRRSADSVPWKAGRPVKWRASGRWGHWQVSFWKGNKFKSFKVHRLVLLAFIGPPPSSGYECCHRDGNPSNNNVENLYWGTSRENKEDARRHGTMVVGARHYLAKLRDADVLAIRWLGRNTDLTTCELSDMFGVHRVQIGNILRNRSWKHVKEMENGLDNYLDLCPAH